MRLINPRLWKTRLQPADLPAPHLEILAAWRDSIQSRAIFGQSETALHGHFVQKILIEVLGYQGFGGDAWTLAQEQPVGAGRVDVALGRFSPGQAHIVAPLELKSAKIRDLDAILPGRHKSAVQQAWEYAIDAPGARWVVVSNYLEIRLYAVGYGRQAYETWDLAALTDPLEYARFQLLLGAGQLLGEGTTEILRQSEQVEQDITARLYRDYKQLRATLLHSLREDNPGLLPLKAIRLAQKILDRVLFVAFAEDHGLLPAHTLALAVEARNLFAPLPIWENFKGLFTAIHQGNAALNIPAYNGGLFAPDPVLEGLQVRDTVCRAFKELGDYDFASEVSVTILGHIFEQSISDIEQLQAEAEGREHSAISKRKQHGVVYTPDTITRFIVEFALGGHLRACFAELWEATAAQRRQNESWKKKDFEIDFWRDYQQILRATRVLDPACGSGAFLVAAFDFLYEEYSRVNKMLADLTGSYGVFDLDKEILNRNLYGVDLNPESVEITKLSLWLKTARRGKVLNSLDGNIQTGNSLIDDPAYTDQPFDWARFSAAVQAGSQDLFDHLPLSGMKQSGFDVVLGNPPYVRQEFISPYKPYLQKYYQVYHGVADLYAYFFELGIRLLKPGGRLGVVSSSTFFKTSSGKNLRIFLQKNTALETIVNFGDLQLFEGVTTYPAILILRKEAPPSHHTFEFLELTRLPGDGLLKDVLRHVSTMPQIILNEDSWILKNGAVTRLWKKLTVPHRQLRHVYGLPLRGVTTGFNQAFVIDAVTRQRIIQADPASNALIKPFLEGKHLSRWQQEQSGLFLIFTRRGVEITAYPGIQAHLSQYQAELTPKPEDWQGRHWSGRKTGSYQWYEIQDTVAYHIYFEMPKIVYLDISSGNSFSMDYSGAYLSNTAYCIPTHDFFLLGLLNSRVSWYFWKNISPILRGGFIRLIRQFVELTPIPDATDIQKKNIADLARECQTLAETRWQKQHAVIRRIPDLCPPDKPIKLSTRLKEWWHLDFSDFRQEIKKVFKQEIPLLERNEWETWLARERAEIELLSAQLNGLEQQLNARVYELFALTGEEIGIIEENA